MESLEKLDIIERGEEKLNYLKRFQIILLFVTALAGQFSLERINPSYEVLGVFGEPRTWLMVLLAIFALPLISSDKYDSAVYEIQRNKLVVLWLVLVLNLFIYMSISALWSTQGSYAKEIILSLAILAALLVFAYLLMRSETQKSIEFFLMIFFIASLIYAVGGLVGTSYWSTRGQLAFLWGGSNAYVRIVGSGAIISLYFWAKSRRRIWLIFVPLLSLTALLSGSRGGMVSFTIAFFLALFVLVRSFLKWSLVLVIVLLFVVVFIFAPFGETYREVVANRFPTSFQELNEAYEHARAPWFSKSIEAFNEAPFLGIGIGGLKNYGIDYSHNLFLNLAAEGGILGLLFLFLTLLPLIATRKRRRTLESNVCLVLAALYFVASMFSGSYYDQRFMWLFLLLYILSTKENSEDKWMSEEVI